MVELDKRIIRLKPEYFRSNINMHDIPENDWVDYAQGYSFADNTTELFLVYNKDPLIVPYKPYFGKLRIDSLSSLKILINGYYALNPGINNVGLERMIKHIYTYDIRYFGDKPAFTLHRIAKLVKSFDITEEFLWLRKYTVYSINSEIPTNEKRNISNAARIGFVGELLNIIADEAIVHTMLTTPYPYKYTNDTILDNVKTAPVKCNNDITIKSKTTLLKRASPNLLKISNDEKDKRVIPIRLRPSHEKYKQLDNSLSIRRKAELSGVVPNTIQRWNKI